jgi:hypothetical protein
MRDGLLWRPKGLLSEQVALTRQAETGQPTERLASDGEPSDG